MSIGWLQIAIIAILVILLFGRGKIASLMGELAQGITSFRKGLSPKSLADDNGGDNGGDDGDGSSQPIEADEIKNKDKR